MRTPAVVVNVCLKSVLTTISLSASPYNLYPFIHKFIHDHYPAGTIILRDSSWKVLGGVLKSLTQGTQAYKTDRMMKIHDWLPKRKFICVGDSTQSDPEAYAEMYKKFPDWVVSYLLRSLSKTRAMVTTYAAGRGRLSLEHGVLRAPYP